MSEVRQALAAWEQHLEEAIGVVHSAHVVDRFDHVITPELLEVTTQRIRMERQADLAVLRGEILAEVRKELAALRGELRGEMADLRGELRGEMADLRGEMVELRGEMADLRTELASVGQDFSDRLERMATSWRRDLLVVTGAQFTALAGAVLVLA